MSNYKSFIDNFDPREGSSRGQADGEYTPRHAKRGVSSSGEYRPRRSSKTESKPGNASPSPVKEGGDDDFDVFNFELARRRKQQREDKLNAELARREAPRKVVDRIAENQLPRRRSQPTQTRTTDRGAQRASDFVGRLSGYAQPLATVFSSGSTREQHRSGSNNRGKGTVSRQGKSSPAKSSAKKNSSGVSRAAAEQFSALPRPMRMIGIACCVVLALIIVYYSAFGVMLSGMESLALTRRKDAPVTETAGLELMSAPGVTNILLLGIDDDGGSGSRSDTIMIASLDTKHGTIRLCSILRDCYVEIPEHKSNRINSAYAHGGAQLAVETVENNFRVKIDHCVTIDMAALVDVVDAVGGVEIELTSAEANQVNLHSHCGKTTAAGKQLLNGKQAVTYAQIRKIDSDFKRTQRQRTLINAIIAKIRSLGIGELMGVVEAVAPNVATDMTSAQIATLAFKALPALSNEMGQLTIPDDGKYSNTTVNGMSVLKLDLEANVKLLHSYLFDE